ncbi:hypothetical protein MICRO8M_50173 [Microbacterium sp. 8M]|nr:hypothetical protein MICRO8M_50173 [Microbacterium sp. 8M]
MVRRPVPGAAAGRVHQPVLVLQRVRAPHRRGGRHHGAGVLERDQPAEPHRERDADQAPRDPRAEQGRLARGGVGAAAQALIASRRLARLGYLPDGDRSLRVSSARAGAVVHAHPGRRARRQRGREAAHAR